MSLVLLPRTGEGLAADALAAFAWLGLLFAQSAATPRARRFAALVGGALAAALWIAAPDGYPVVAAALAAYALFGAVLAPSSRRDPVALLGFVALVAAPASVALAVWALGDERARETLRGEWRLPELSFLTYSIATRVVAVGAAAWLGIGLAEERDRTNTAESRAIAVVPFLAFAAVLARVAMRAASIGSMAILPEDAGWSELAAVGNLLKLRVGAPLFGPFSECSSYSYAPTLEILHHALLSPFGLDLSLVANRVLAIGWQLSTAMILTTIVMPFVKGQRATRSFVAAAAWLVASSSFLAPHVHPDHLLMPWFALALGVALHAESLRSRLVVAAFVLVPVVATTVKLTGAGIGLGLVLAFALPLRRRNVLALGAGGVLSLASLALYERLHPGFWQYTFRLQASHALRWGELPAILEKPAGRVFILAVALFVILRFVAGERARDVSRDVRRVLLVTVGFALPSAVAYLKIGGRENSLLPLSIGAAVACARMLAFLLEHRTPLAASRAFATALGVALAITVCPHDMFIPRAIRDAVRERHARMVEYVQAETARGRRVVVPQSTAAWIAAGHREVPFDRWQTIGELALGGHPEAAICRDRIVSGEYDSIVIDSRFLDPIESPGTAQIAPALDRNFVLVEDRPIADGLVPSIRLYRRKP